MKSNAWFVLFPKAKLPGKESVLRTLREIKGVRVDTTGEAMKFTVIAVGGHFDVGLNVSMDVVVESREAVERARDELEKPEEIAAYDARFELLFSRDEIGVLFNPLLAAAERLARLTAGVVYESDNGVFQ
ncbi:MAG: hypothetical protein KIT31_02230 [Deltaproteobacteria bacterium]|nr:hypothetical protein [Deltaproteobacteria bacterium]